MSQFFSRSTNRLSKLESAQRSVTGGRTANEDRCYASSEQGLFIVADGMGGHQGGALASQIAVEVVPQTLSEISDGLDGTLRGRVSALPTAIQAASGEMTRIAKSHPQYARMGCTLAATIIADGVMHFTHVGDCRIYLHRNGRLHLLTSDETIVQGLVDANAITQFEAAKHPLRHVVCNSVSARGIRNRPSVSQLQLQADDTILLTSDGLSNVLDDQLMAEIIQSSQTPQQCVDQLVETALQRHARDNVSCVVMRAVDHGTGVSQEPGAGGD